MDKDLKDLLGAARKRRREVAELQQLRTQLKQLKNPDPKLLAKIDEELKARNA